MKLKKIEISAFRIYNEPENALFDFTIKSENIADFVSLYAPNGFGKTSFYDAVEWVITGSVNRFFIRKKEYEKLETNQSAKNKIPLLRNSKLERDTYVKLFTNSDKKPIEKNISRDSNKSDLILKKSPKSHNFQKVILSQEWISAFLTEKDGVGRYNKFMENPELSEINKYYLNLKHLLSAQKSNEDLLKEELKRLMAKVKNVKEQNLLEIVNLQIKKINEIIGKSVLTRVKIETTEKEIVAFKDLISKNVIHYNKEQKAILDRIDKLRLAKTGNDNLLSLKLFRETKATLRKTLKSIEKFEGLLEKFEDKEKRTNELDSKLQTQKEFVTEKESIELILSKFKQFETIKNLIKSKADLTEKLQNNLPELTEAIEKLKREEANVNEQLNTCLKTITTYQTKQKALPAIEKEINSTNNKLTKINKFLLKQNSKKELLENNIKDLQNKTLEYENLIENVQKDKYSTKHLKKKPKLLELVKELKKNQKTLVTERKKIGSINEKIEQQQSINSSIELFIEQGLNIVNERQTATCPLCEHQYNDFQTLVNKISKNKALTNILKDLLTEKNVIKDRLNKLEEKLKIGKQKLVEFYQKKIDGLSVKIDDKQEDIDAVKKLIEEANSDLEELNSNKEKLIVSMDGLGFDDYKNQISKLINIELANKKEFTKSYSNCKRNLNKKEQEQKNVNSKILLSRQEREKQSKDVDYLAVVDYFKENYPSKNISKAILKKALADLKQSILEVNATVKKLHKKINTLISALSQFNQDNLKIQITDLEQKRTTSENKIDNYILFFKDNLEIDISELNGTEISKIIKNSESNCKTERNENKIINDEYVSLEKNSEHIFEFLQTEKAKKDIEIKQEELSFLESSVRPNIEEERQRVKQHLEKKIRGFFYEELINKLYEKIDPHPNFKKVRFIPNLDLGLPRLDVFVEDEKSLNLIPNLYFSTAQRNILSLCIFLASALKSNDYDCIFIDDPIQSMDSINTLATIDLLRSIVVNHKKQIILSTHDENFHKLLKKKMPADLFKSKFLKLKTFGQVIEDV